MSLLLALTGGGPVGIPVVASDTVSFSDSAVCLVNAVATATDSASFTDSAVCLVNAVAGAADTVNFTDSAVCFVNAVATASDTRTVSDSAVCLVNAVATASDTISFSDSAVCLVNAVATASDTRAVSDSAVAIKVSGGIVATADDTVAFTDSAIAAKAPNTNTGGHAWLRAWLQEQYSKDFARNEAERAVREAPEPTALAPEPVARVAPRPRALPPEPAPQELAAEVLRVLARRSAQPQRATVPELPPERDLRSVRRAVAAGPKKLAAGDLHHDEVEAVLVAAIAFNL